MAPAVRAAIKSLGLSANTKVEELLAASDSTTSLSGDGTSYDSGKNDDDLIIGSKRTDELAGNAGADILAGMKGADTLSGGTGGDLFVFTTVRDSKAKVSDTITDFGNGADRIALSAVGDLALLAKEDAAFTGGAEIRWFHDGNETIVEVDVDGDTSADMRIVLAGSLTLDETDFLL